MQLQSIKQQHLMTILDSIKKGFTLIELLIVISIIGILTVLITTNFQGSRARARDIRRKSDLRSIQQSLRLYYNDANSFPAHDLNFQITGASWGGTFANGATIYMSSLPTDPSSSTDNPVTYNYYSNSGDTQLLVASLENSSDLDIAESQARCSAPYSLYSGAGGAVTDTDYLICDQ